MCWSEEEKQALLAPEKKLWYNRAKRNDGDDSMANTHFDFLTLNFLQKAEVYPGSLGTFRYRLKREGKANNGSIQAWVYENICFEKAQDIETETFPWTPEGMEALRNWLEQKLEERGSQPYGIWRGNHIRESQ